jgi:hypothetical protein
MKVLLTSVETHKQAYHCNTHYNTVVRLRSHSRVVDKKVYCSAMFVEVPTNSQEVKWCTSSYHADQARLIWSSELRTNSTGLSGTGGILLIRKSHVRYNNADDAHCTFFELCLHSGAQVNVFKLCH